MQYNGGTGSFIPDFVVEIGKIFINRWYDIFVIRVRFSSKNDWIFPAMYVG